ncbi:MAG TPA: hypothetical protein VE130_15665 [Nitrososphaeraceae archaeon]|nr:hypothetical protein [Nitrososphaeraceae archaeon]
MPNHKLLQLQKLIEVKIGSLKEEIEVGTNVKLNPLYLADQRDEIQVLEWTARIIQSILNQDYYERQQLGMLKRQLETIDMIEFENILQERIEGLNFKKNSNNLHESNFLKNEIDMLESILGRLSDLKYGEETRAIEVANANNDFKRANHLRKQLIKIQHKRECSYLRDRVGKVL